MSSPTMADETPAPKTELSLKQKQAKIKQALAKLGKSKENSGMRVGFGEVDELSFSETPFVTLNTLIGGGFPKGKFTVIAGPSMSGKTTLLQQWVAHQQKLDPNWVCLWTDAEESLDLTWCETLGIDTERLLVQKYSTEFSEGHMEGLLQQGADVIATGAVDAWVIDSIGALTPSSEVKKELVESQMLDLQRNMGKFFRKVIPSVALHKVACIILGHIYTVPTAHGGLEEVKGGNAVKHWAYVRLKTRRGKKDLAPETIEVIMPDGTRKKINTGWPQVLKLDKTKTNANENQEVVLKFVYGRGFDSVDCAISALFAHDVMERKGSWYLHEKFPEHEASGECKINGKENVIDFLKGHPALLSVIISQLDAQLAIAHNQDDEETATT